MYTVRINEEMRRTIVRAFEADQMVNPSAWDAGTDTGGISKTAPIYLLYNSFRCLPMATPGEYGDNSFYIRDPFEDEQINIPKPRTEVVILHESATQSAISDLITMGGWTSVALLGKWLQLTPLFWIGFVGVTLTIMVLVALKRGLKRRYTIEQARTRIDELEAQFMGKSK